MNDESKLKILLSKFKKIDDYEIEDYYGVSVISTIDNKFRIKLQYNYIKAEGNATLSKSYIEIDSFEETVEFFRVLHKFSVDKSYDSKNKNNISGLFEKTVKKLDSIEAKLEPTTDSDMVQTNTPVGDGSNFKEEVIERDIESDTKKFPCKKCKSNVVVGSGKKVICNGCSQRYKVTINTSEDW